MVSREHRFHGLGSLRFVYGRGKIVRGPMFRISYAPNTRRKTYRVAVVVSKRVDKSAVVRNRIRRRIYELVREREAQINAPYDLVITVHDPGVAKLPHATLEVQLVKQLTGAGII